MREGEDGAEDGKFEVRERFGGGRSAGLRR